MMYGIVVENREVVKADWRGYSYIRSHSSKECLDL